jgi:hypothetical protein
MGGGGARLGLGCQDHHAWCVFVSSSAAYAQAHGGTAALSAVRMLLQQSPRRTVWQYNGTTVQDGSMTRRRCHYLI